MILRGKRGPPVKMERGCYIAMMKEQPGNLCNLPLGSYLWWLYRHSRKGLLLATYDPRQYHVCIWSSIDDGETWERNIEADTQWPLVATCDDPPLMSISNVILLQDATGQWNKVSIGSDSSMIRRVVSLHGNETDDRHNCSGQDGEDECDGNRGRDKFDPNNTILIALTTTGLHRSDDWGASWQQDHEDLPIEQIIDIAASTTDLYVLLAGGQVWKRSL